MHRALTTALASVGSLMGHHGGDYLAQPDWCARNKQARTPTGRVASDALGQLRGIADEAEALPGRIHAAVTDVEAYAGRL